MSENSFKAFTKELKTQFSIIGSFIAIFWIIEIIIIMILKWFRQTNQMPRQSR